jgi:hypothetical protein
VPCEVLIPKTILYTVVGLNVWNNKLNNNNKRRRRGRRTSRKE